MFEVTGICTGTGRRFEYTLSGAQGDILPVSAP